MLSYILLFFKSIPAFLAKPSSLAICLLFTVFVHFFEVYIFNDYQFAISLAILVVVDTIFELIKAIKFRVLSAKQGIDFMLKVIIFTLFLVSVHVMVNYTVNGDRNSLFTWLDQTAYGIIVSWEFGMICKSIIILGGGFAKKLLKYFEDFDDQGNYVHVPHKNKPATLRK